MLPVMILPQDRESRGKIVRIREREEEVRQRTDRP